MNIVVVSRNPALSMAVTLGDVEDISPRLFDRWLGTCDPSTVKAVVLDLGTVGENLTAVESLRAHGFESPIVVVGSEVPDAVGTRACPPPVTGSAITTAVRSALAGGSNSPLPTSAILEPEAPREPDIKPTAAPLRERSDLPSSRAATVLEATITGAGGQSELADAFGDELATLETPPAFLAQATGRRDRIDGLLTPEPMPYLPPPPPPPPVITPEPAAKPKHAPAAKPAPAPAPAPAAEPVRSPDPERAPAPIAEPAAPDSAPSRPTVPAEAVPAAAPPAAAAAAPSAVDLTGADLTGADLTVADLTVADVAVADLVSALSQRAEELYSVPDVAELIITDAVDHIAAHGGAVLVADAGVWRVAAGIELRPLEYRLELTSSHWLIQHIVRRNKAVIVEDTDIARQKLHGAPLASWRHFLLVPLPGHEALVILARLDAPAFSDSDLTRVVRLVEEAAPFIDNARAVRDLARALDIYRDLNR